MPLHDRLDYTFPAYNPNPEAMEMLHDMARAVRESGADIALGFDGDGDRCGVVDDEGDEIFADKVGVLLARDWIRLYPGARLVADVKSTGLFASDPELIAGGASVDYWKTGHSHMKRRVRELGALAGFEKSGHHFLAPPIGRGYDDGLLVAVEICRMLDRHPGQSMSDLKRSLPRTWSTPTMSPFCPDEEKYAVAARLTDRLVAMKGGRLGPLADRGRRHRQRRARPARGRRLGAGPPVLQHAEPGRRRRERPVRGGTARHLRRHRRDHPRRARRRRL